MGFERPESRAKSMEGQECPVTREVVREALRRRAGEGLPETPDRRSEYIEAERTAAGELTLSALELPPNGAKDSLMRLRLKNAARRGEIPQSVAEVVWERCRTIYQGLEQLWNDPRTENFRPENANPAARNVFGGYLKRIREMLTQAMREGLVRAAPNSMFARPANRVGYAMEWLEELRTMQQRLGAFKDTTPEIESMKGYIRDFASVLQDVLNGDPRWTAAYNAFHPKRPESEAGKEMKAAGKMLGLLALAGGTLLSVLFHIKDKSPPSASTAVWGGLTAWVAGAFQDRNSTVSQQLAFIPKSEWETLTETLGIHGAGGNKIIRRIRLAHSREETKRMLTQLKKRQMPEAHLVELRRKYIAKITGAEMTPDGRPTGKNAALATQFLALSHDQLVFLCESIVNATDASARGVLAYLTEHGVSSRTVAAEIRRCSTLSA